MLFLNRLLPRFDFQLKIDKNIRDDTKIISIFVPASGKVQEWLNWHAWKACKPLKGFGGSNPPLSAEIEMNESWNKCLTLFFFEGFERRDGGVRNAFSRNIVPSHPPL